MLKFFRNIRRKLISKSKLTSYMLYALGEIILVVIGILIALQINNWNEFRKDRIREKMYLSSLQSDLQESQAELERVIYKTDTIILATLQVLEYASDTAQLPPAAVFDSLIVKTFGYTIAMTNEGTINDIRGSGDLKVIRDDRLRRMIASWDAGFKMIREREALLKTSFENNKIRLDDKIDMVRLNRLHNNLTDEEERYFILHDRKFRNGFVDLVRDASVLNRLYKNKIKNLDTMIQFTQHELRKI
ncbi:hypothetical protein C7S20_09055 [Christiangramia fulva]|uniref:Uncharacterized protein n=1 Tax=Christiangramia fulva TaxID=2126553 RepID=A0A2R3Z549_9FLAO|nr:DUF6090 family protein [Christiangramia fulva]AVR45406.1 hypothetical protein C7S20_09055 [Christiangramia fulva]